MAESINSTNSDFTTTGATIVGGRKQEKAPLLSQRRLFRSLSGQELNNSNGNDSSASVRTLGSFAGVFAPVALSQFSTLLFLRVGFIVGNAGLILTCSTLSLAYIILLFTVLSICAICTNGAVEGGGAYYMISRTLGPEFGGAIGALFLFANIFSSALYITGCVEGLIQSFGLDSGTLVEALPQGSWYSFGYGSALNAFNLVVSLIGAAMFAKTTVAILIVVLTCTISVFISFMAVHHELEVPIPSTNEVVYPNATNITVYGSYTGMSWSTFEENLYQNYTTDYTTGDTVTYATVFSVLFSGVTGIMAGANMSGELKEPGRNIPVGTLAGVCFTFCTYLILFALTAATSSQYLLQNNFLFMMGINLWPPFITIGIMTATLSASLSNLIGGSRIMAALVKDDIYGKATKWIGLLTFGSNPIGAVLLSFVLVEAVLLIGELNTIAKFTSIFFLLSYFATNLACLGLDWASAPNFRPGFKYFSWWTALLGIVSNGVMMFVISPSEAGVCVIVCLVLVIILHLRSPSEQHQWGSISQALIFHQVRKYLLLLDSRKDHVKFWRPQMLLMVANPRSACPLIDFTNDLKKSGLYVLGHVKVGNFEDLSTDPTAEDYPKWLAFVDHLKVKAFVEVTVGRSVRDGLSHLARIAGLGAMKPNTILFGFCDNTPSQDFFTRFKIPTQMNYGSISVVIDSPESPGESSPFNVSGYQASSPNGSTPTLLGQRGGDSKVGPQEFVGMVCDVINMGKNVCVCRHFHLLDKTAILKSSGRSRSYIDVWPIDFFNPDEGNIFDTTSLFLMQLATILNMVSSWRKKTRLRVFLCISSRNMDPAGQEKQLRNMLQSLRIQANIVIVNWDHVISHLIQESRESGCEAEADTNLLSHLSAKYITAVNSLMAHHRVNTAVTFLYLPCPPLQPALHPHYLQLLTMLTENNGPMVMVHGVSAVTTTNL